MNKKTENELPQTGATNARQAMQNPALAGTLRISSKQLFAGKSEIEIEHNGMSYRLRQTSLGKLILTK